MTRGTSPGRTLAVIGASWGGLEALGIVLGKLDADIALGVAVAQHRHPASPRGAMRDFLAARCSLPIEEPGDKTAIRPSCVYIAPSDYHLLVDGARFALSVDEPVQFSRPSVDVLFESAAQTRGRDVVAVVLTGSNRDGAEGLAAVKAAGGLTIVQDPDSAERREMPEAALDARPHWVLGLEDIGALLNEVAA